MKAEKLCCAHPEVCKVLGHLPTARLTSTLPGLDGHLHRSIVTSQSHSLQPLAQQMTERRLRETKSSSRPAQEGNRGCCRRSAGSEGVSGTVTGPMAQKAASGKLLPKLNPE